MKIRKSNPKAVSPFGQGTVRQEEEQTDRRLLVPVRSGEEA